MQVNSPPPESAIESCSTVISGNKKIQRIPSLTTVISEIQCTEPFRGNVQRHDFTKQGVPPNNKTDVLVLTSGVVKESGLMFFQRAGRVDMWFVYLAISLINILFIISALVGINSPWYKSLNKSGLHPLVAGALWIVATAFSYGAIFMIWEHVKEEDIPRDLTLSVYFLIGSFLSLLWSTVLFQGNNIALALWLVALLFLYQFWLFTYIWKIKPGAALFMIPLVIMYGYLFYNMIRLAILNHVKL